MTLRWIDVYRKRGFVGPRYRGILGKLRFAIEHLVKRTDVVSVATPESFLAVAPPPGPSIEVHWIDSPEGLRPHTGQFESEYYPGFLDSWWAAFKWGETLILGTVDDRVAAFVWLQQGTDEGLRFPWGCLLPGDARMVRGGVLPSFRRQGVNTRFKYLALKATLDRGAHRVHIDCHRNNRVSLKSQIRAGFRPVGEMTVLGPLLGRNFVRWKAGRVRIDDVK